MSPQLIIAALIAAAGFGSAWQIQSWRADAKEKDRVEQELVDQRNAATTAIRRTEAVIQAQSAATVRDGVLRRDAAGARDALVGLSLATEQALRDAATTHAACTERARALGVVLGTVAAAGGEVSAKADRHASDAKTLTDAWPR